MKQVTQLHWRYLIDLSEEDVFGLVFLDNSEVRPIVDSRDRCMRTLAQKALQLLANNKGQLSSNWNLSAVLNRPRKELAAAKASLPPLLLRDSNDSERAHGPLYLQDGCHRSLGYAMVMIRDGIPYPPLRAYHLSNHLRRAGPV